MRRSVGGQGSSGWAQALPAAASAAHKTGIADRTMAKLRWRRLRLACGDHRGRSPAGQGTAGAVPRITSIEERTMATQSGAIPRYRQYDGPAILQQGFRPFFLMAGLWALLAMAIWGWQFGHGLMLPTLFGWSAWHAHEMLFGYLAAALAGFLLTAVPNWTGRMPLQGLPLAGLVALWAVGRLAVLVSAQLGAWPTLLLDLAFLATLLAVILREILAGRNWRNLPVTAALAALLAANALSHAGAAGWIDANLGLRFGIAIFAVLIALIGGRIVPSFTRNWLSKRGAARMPAKQSRFDQAAVLVTLAAALAWTLQPTAAWTAGLAAVAALANAVRLARWRGLKTWREPLLFVLHAGYAWLPVGFAAVALAPVWPDLTQTAALHALTAGAMGLMPLAVMTRATLGHTGRALTADGASTACFVLVAVSALTRIVATLWPAWTLTLYGISALTWILAFALFLWAYAPKLAARG
jgi:uncharacterized protein involved in response to NO